MQLTTFIQATVALVAFVACAAPHQAQGKWSSTILLLCIPMFSEGGSYCLFLYTRSTPWKIGAVATPHTPNRWCVFNRLQPITLRGYVAV
jgi:hypothetical protein